jgi:hypothetical protein
MVFSVVIVVIVVRVVVVVVVSSVVAIDNEGQVLGEVVPND